MTLAFFAGLWSYSHWSLVYRTGHLHLALYTEAQFHPKKVDIYLVAKSNTGVLLQIIHSWDIKLTFSCLFCWGWDFPELCSDCQMLQNSSSFLLWAWEGGKSKNYQFIQNMPDRNVDFNDQVNIRTFVRTFHLLLASLDFLGYGFLPSHCFICIHRLCMYRCLYPLHIYLSDD